MSISNRYPELTIELKCGRRLRVHAFVWEPSYSEAIDIGSAASKREVQIERKQLQIESIIGKRKTHFIGPEFVDKYQNHPPRIPNTAVTVWLSSTPLSEEALFSELLVVFFLDYQAGASIESILLEHLDDLDWENHAEDVSEATNNLWKEVWVERTVH